MIFAFASQIGKTGAEYDVVIVGAGWAGLSAARTLYENGVTNFVVLEAHDYIGGRCKSRVMYDDVIYEEGTAYLTGTDDNLVFNAGESYNTEWVEHEYKYEVYRDGELFPNNGTEKFWEWYNGIWSAWGEQWYTYYILDYNSSLADVIDYYAGELNLTDDEDLALFEAAEERASYDYAAVLEKFAVYAGNFDESASGGIVIAKNGLSELVNRYAEPLLPYVKLSSVVRKIDYSAHPAVVTYVDEFGDEVTIEGTNVLVTVPFGVLKAGDIEFVPSFVEQGSPGQMKQAAIDIMLPGKYEKIALFWKDMTEDEIFWDTSVPHAMHVQDDQQGNFTHWNSYYHVNKVTMLESSASQEYVDAIETLPDDVVVAQAVERLRMYYGEDVVPDPTHYYLPRWYAEPFTKTIYAYAEPGATFETRAHLTEPLDDRLYFAGESTYEERFGTVHGAMKSGLLAIEKIYPNQTFPLSESPSKSPNKSPKKSATKSPTKSATKSPTKSPSVSDSSHSNVRNSVFVPFYLGVGLSLVSMFSLLA